MSRISHDVKEAAVSRPTAGWRSSSASCPSARHSSTWRSFALGAALLGAVAASGCTQVRNHGYMAPEGALEQLPLGSTQEQVLIVLGTPSTVATISGEVFYYISQRSEQTSFISRETDRRVIAVYFDKNRRVQRLADYGMKDGKIFDYVSRTTPSGGTEQNTLGLMFKIFKS